MKFLSTMRFPFMSTPSRTIPANEAELYFKSDGKLYKKIGTAETAIEGAGAGVGVVPMTTIFTGTLASGWTGTIQYQQFGNVVTLYVQALKSSWSLNEIITPAAALPAAIRPPAVGGIIPVGNAMNASVNNLDRPFWIDVNTGHIRAANDGTGSIWGSVTYQVAGMASAASSPVQSAAVQTTAQSLASGVHTTLTNWTDDYITTGISRSGGAFTIAAAGRYRMMVRVGFAAAILNNHGAGIQVNGTRVATQQYNLVYSIPVSAEVTRTMTLAAGDVVTFTGIHFKGSANDTIASLGYTVCAIEKIN